MMAMGPKSTCMCHPHPFETAFAAAARAFAEEAEDKTPEKVKTTKINIGAMMTRRRCACGKNCTDLTQACGCQ